MKLAELLKAKGWTDEQITAALSNPQMVETLEAAFSELATERDTFKKRDEAWQAKLETEYNPAIGKAEKDAAEARRRAADLEEQVKIAREYGYLSSSEADEKLKAAAAAAASRNDPNAYDPKRHPTFDDVNRFAEAEGQAIALANYLVLEYQYLTGKNLFEYETTINGTTRRGMTALREEAKAARKNLDLYVSEKFDFNGLRLKQREARQKEHDDKIRLEATETVRREYAEKFGNPALAMPTPSRQPFMPSKPASGKQPWEVPAAERRAGRIRHAMESQMKSGPVQ